MTTPLFCNLKKLLKSKQTKRIDAGLARRRTLERRRAVRPALQPADDRIRGQRRAIGPTGAPITALRPAVPARGTPSIFFTFYHLQNQFPRYAESKLISKPISTEIDPRSHWFCIGFHTSFTQFSSSSLGFYLVLIDCISFYRVLLGFNGFPWLIPGFFVFWPGFIELYSIASHFTGFYWVFDGAWFIASFIVFLVLTSFFLG